MENPEVIDEVRNWLRTMVIGLELCPFAESVYEAGTIRYAVCNSREPSVLFTVLGDELQRLVATPRSDCETTLLIAPEIFPAFLDFNDFVGVGERLIEDLMLSGVVQIVGFHPRFQFADTAEDAPRNYTNRSPFPVLHLLREESVTEVSSRPQEIQNILRRNTETLEQLGTARILERVKSYTTHSRRKK